MTRPRALFVFTVAFAICMIANTAFGQDVLKVTENWEMVVGSADAATGAPQINTVLSAFPHVDSYYGLFTINYRDLPSFSPGGLQTQLWQDITNLSVGPDVTGTMNTANETVTWQQYLELSKGKIRFHVHNGQSTTWGAFGGGAFCAPAISTALTNLNGYTPTISVDYARRWGYGRDRIVSLKILSIEKKYLDGTITTDTTPIVVLPN